jgi:2-amino-4-hydroxy-6-hydroxymethyldihydropteridine diphosphokinase
MPIALVPGGSLDPRELAQSGLELAAPAARDPGALYAALRRELGFERVTLVGRAEGAALACDFSLRFPGFAERLVLVDASIPAAVVPTEALLLVSAAGLACDRDYCARAQRAFPSRVGPLRQAGPGGDWLPGAIRHLCRARPARVGDELAFVSLGSNLGDRERHLCAGFAALRALRGVRDVVASRVYETDPVGPGRQAPYLNAAACLFTDLMPRALLAELLAIERSEGRARSGVRNEPRTLDLDLLLYGDRMLAEPDLAVPHPRLAERPFVLEPLSDLAPDLVPPGARASLSALAAAVRDPAAVRVRET